MIVENKSSGVVIVPVMAGPGLVQEKIRLLPGLNEVPIEKWEKARESAALQLSHKVINEIAAEVKLKKEEIEVVDKKTKEKVKKIVEKQVLAAKEFSDLEAGEAEKLVKETSSLDTLNKWKKSESRESVRLAIANRIDEVEKYTPNNG